MTSDMEPSSTNSPPDVNDGLSPGVRWIASALIAFHVFAVFIAPFHFSTRASDGFDSPASGPIRSFIDPYIRFMYLDHGYFFFAPDPGPSHLIRYEVRFADGRKVTGQLPDLEKQWPRLLYHRHFMISESLHNSFASPAEPQPPQPPPADAPVRFQREYRRIKDDWQTQVHESWKNRRRMYETFRESLKDHVRSLHEGEGEIEEIKLARIEHRLIFPGDHREGVDGREERFLVELDENPGPEPQPWNPATPSSPTKKPEPLPQ
jgi:hypothetical protein